MALPWARIDTNIASHDKILTLLGVRNGRAIAFSYVCAITYSVANGTDGHIPFAALPFIHSTRKEADTLVEVGLFVPNPKGWTVKNFDQRQQLSFTTTEVRAAKSIAGSKGACVKNHGPECGCWKDKTGRS